MESAVGRLIQEARLSRRPKWSQQFLADELCRIGYETTREQIARLERCEPCRANAELLAAISAALHLDEQVLQTAIFEDYLSVASALSVRLPQMPRLMGSDIPTRVPRAMPQRGYA
jgi:hypothetical protein